MYTDTYRQRKGNLMPQTQYNTGKIVGLAVAFILLVFLLVSSFSMVENVDSSEITVIQSPFGKLNVYTTPGPKWQGFGKVTSYQKRAQYSFSAAKDQGKDAKDESIQARFNDGGHAFLSGVINWEMPTDYEHVVSLHMKYGSQEAVDQQLVRPTIEKSVYMTGPLMSSKESANEKRTYLIAFIEDQIANGVYQTYTEDVKQPDPITGEQKTVSIVKLREKDGVLLRQDESPLKTFGIRTFGLSLNSVKYDDRVEAQIQQQQQAIMQVQTAIANAKKAEQDAITAQKNGEAEAAKAKWEQEVIKAKMVTEGEARVAVAKLNNEAAELEKQALIKKGEGEGAYRLKVMAGDGGLDKKLAAYVEVQKAYAAALGTGHVQIVPSVVSGGGNGSSANGMNFLEILGIKAAKDLAVDLQASGQQQTR